MGYQFKDVCYSTESLAQDAYALSMPPAFVMYQSTNVVFYPEKIEGEWCFGRHAITTGVNAQCFSINMPQFQNCTVLSDPVERFKTGLELGSAVAFVILIGFLMRYIRVRH